ncbi:hypothetical protein ACLOJK_018441 [Asimina triloba]
MLDLPPLWSCRFGFPPPDFKFGFLPSIRLLMVVVVSEEEGDVIDLLAALLAIKLPEMGKTPDSMAATAQPVGFEGDSGAAAGSGMRMQPIFFRQVQIYRYDVTGDRSAGNLLGKMEHHTSVLRRFTEINAHARAIRCSAMYIK